MLTAKKEKFVQSLIAGLSQRQAYKKAYNAKKMKDDTIDNKAYLLFKDKEVRARYDELLARAQDEAVMSAKERMIWLSNVVNGKVKHISYGTNGEEYENEAYISDKLKAIDTLNKMTREYTTKVEGNINVSYEDSLRAVSGNNEY